jgi:hypothetical protein
MKQYLEEESVITHYSNGPLPDKRWQSDAVRPLSREPKDQGLYVATTYDKFFAAELEQNKNGTRRTRKK